MKTGREAAARAAGQQVQSVIAETTDEKIERSIEEARLLMTQAYGRGDKESARTHAATMSSLIALRSPEKVIELEVTRGLR